MTDLINKKIKDKNKKIEEFFHFLMEKYKPLLVDVHDENKLLFSCIIHIAINFINNKHNSLDRDFKIWCIYILKHIFLDNALNLENVKDEITFFIEHYNNEYDKYNKNTFSVNDFEKKSNFIFLYLKNNKKINEKLLYGEIY